MAVTFTQRLQYVDTTDRGTDGILDAVYTTTSVSFTADRPVIIGVAAMHASATVNFPAISGPSGVTLTRLFDWVRGGLDPSGAAGSRRCFYWLAKPTSTVSGTLTFTFTQQAIQTVHAHAIELSGADVDAANPVLQLQGSLGDVFATATSVDLSPFNNTNNGVILMGFHGAAETVTPETGWTLTADTTGDATGFHSLTRTSNDTTATATWASSVHHVFAAFEVGRRTSLTSNIYKVPRGKGSTGSATSITTGQLWLRADHHAIMCCRNVVASPATITPSGTGLTFTQIRTVVHPSNVRFTAWHVLVGSTDFVGTVTFTADGGAAQNPWGYLILLAGGGLLTGTNGADAIRQSATGTASSATSLSVPLAAFRQSTNRTVMVLNYGNNTTTTTLDSTPAGWTLIDSITPSGQTLHGSTVGEADTSPTHTFSSSINASGIALEYEARSLAGAVLSRNPGEEIVAALNRNAGTTNLEFAGAANALAGTTGLEGVGALNVKAGNPNGSYKDLEGVLRQLGLM